ncbi:unnamed protein product [Phytophthora lilii]|uniref:Unnamed protein product n=1 Tax=Phytophthora lilii TaxID=2077276 RepID=A0A9W6U9L7_9STRA|nr:unnamed protein product [Phytophthora lilii]
MELAAWRDAVPYGAYLQPIHLQVAGPDAAHATSSAVQESPSKSTHSAPHSSQKPVEGSADGTPEIPQPPEPPADTGEAQNAAQSIDETKDVTVIPPFASECLNNGEQMALNVGGPVWAMDWLPSKPAANAAAVAAALVKTKQKKGRRTSAAAKKAAKKTAKGKENNQVETLEGGEITAASNGSAEAEEGGQQNWRFLALATHPPCQVEDGKLVKATPPDHYYDVPESERNLIQIWAVPVNRPSTTGTGQNRKGKVAKRKLVKPRLVYAIDHDSGVAWDLQWCPLVKKFPKADRRENILGVLAACFGDGSMRVFEIPAIADTRLQMSISKEAVVEKSIPVVIAKLPRILQLSVQWSPHNWNMLLTGGSDGKIAVNGGTVASKLNADMNLAGSVSLWNIKSAITERDSLGNLHTTPEPIEPQRRYQDGKFFFFFLRS